MPRTTKQAVPDDELLAPRDPLLDAADALHRWATEVCHQHDRYARLQAQTSEPAELRAAVTLVRQCDATLCDMVKRYEKAGAGARPDGDNAWWHSANALWLASREYVRRHEGCDRAERSVASGRTHSAERFGELQLHYELEASALLAVRQAAEGFHKARNGRPASSA